MQPNISKTLGRIWHVGLLHKPKSYGISVQVCNLTLSFLSNGEPRVILDGKSSHPVVSGGAQGSILGPALFLNGLPGDDIICNTAISTDILLSTSDL